MKLVLAVLLLGTVLGAVTGAPYEEATPDEEAMLEELLEAATSDNRRTGLSLLDKKHHKLSKLTSLSSLSHHDHHDHHEHHDHDHDYSHSLDYDHKSFDLWSFKKAILHALLQALKAITGGVIALKGHLVKVKGHLVSAKGEFLKHKGEAIKEFGKHIATKALLTPVAPPSGFEHHVHEHHHEIHHEHHGVPGGPYPTGYGPVPAHPPHTGHSGPSHEYLPHPPPPPQHYGPPLHPSLDPYGSHLKRDAEDAKLPDGVQAGLILLKPIEVPKPGFSIEQQNVYQVPQEFSKNSRIDPFGIY